MSAGEPEPKRRRIEQLSDVDHVLKRPAVYFGSSLNLVDDSYTFFDASLKNPQQVKGKRSPALEKAIDEVLINARDHAFRKGTGVKEIHVSHLDDGAIVIHNDGKGVPLDKVSRADGTTIYAPELAFGNLRAGDNFSDDAERTTGGCNGVGSKLTNLFSSIFQVETRRSTKLYRQLWEDQMRKCNPPTITKADKETMRGTKITFMPRYDLFKISK